MQHIFIAQPVEVEVITLRRKVEEETVKKKGQRKLIPFVPRSEEVKVSMPERKFWR